MIPSLPGEPAFIHGGGMVVQYYWIVLFALLVAAQSIVYVEFGCNAHQLSSKSYVSVQSIKGGLCGKIQIMA